MRETKLSNAGMSCLLLVALWTATFSSCSASSYFPYSISNQTLSSSYPVTLHGYRQCNPNLCHNGGTCVFNAYSKPFCRCPPRYAGHLCEHSNPCFAANRCMNGGTCQTITSPNSPPTFKCLCPLGFSASLCEVEEPNVCLRTRPCENGGRCVLKGDVEHFECQCAPGWRGPRCQEADHCVSQPCRNGAICHSHSNGTKSGLATSSSLSSSFEQAGAVGYSCDCAPGFRGPTCADDIDECAEKGSASACHHNGLCLNTPGSYRCNCEQGYTGQFCESRYVPCEVNPCVSGGECVPHYGSSTYKCVCPTGFSGGNCELNVDDCGGHLCQNGGSCVDGVNTYSCACPANFSGPYCSQDVDECSLRPHVCQNGATCANTNGGFACICVNGWTGPTCAENIDDCSNQPCFNGATCHDRVGSFFCQCPPGKTGLLCHLEDACASNPCHAGSICDTSPLDGTYVCSCPTGYKGTDCTLDIDECQDSGSPCEHGGTCVNTPGSFKCDCALGFAGTRCEININECDSNPCQNEGTCLDERGSYRCVCMPGYAGTHCESNIDECLSSPCQNNAVCTDLINGYRCLCPYGFEGTNCEKSVDQCYHNQCRNGGTCHNVQSTYSCNCPDGFTGRNCEININDCESNPCFNGKCIDSINSFKCICNPGYTGLMCQSQINECLSNPCLFGGTCIDQPSGYECKCPNGTSGTNCEFNDNECWSNPCFNGGTCHDQIGKYRCQCPVGFRGEQCEVDIDECQSNPCANGATCYNLPNAFKCVCPKGFYGSRCLSDIDECADSPCLNGGTCEDDLNKFLCHCPRGFTGRRCEANIDDCASNPCQNNGYCYDQIGNFSCQCQHGFTGLMCEINIDDCASKPCLNGGRCKDMIGAFRCDCPNGFTGNYCDIDIDECATNPCANGGVCLDRPNGYQCDCRIGYYGPNCQSTSPECRPEYCSSNGQCQMKGNQVSCVCNPGYTGYKCETKMDICDSNPCRNGGVCIGTGFGSYKCRCPFTHSGSNCEFQHDTLSILSQGPWKDCPNALHCHERFGNKNCDPECNSPQCFYDGFDCRSENEDGQNGQFRGQCLPVYDTYCALNYGNGHCDQGCNNSACGWDGMDCLNEKYKKEVMIVLVVENLSIDKLNGSSNNHPKKATELLRQLSIGTGNVFSLDEMKSTETGTELMTKMDTSKCDGTNACIQNAEDFKRWIRFNQYTESKMEQYLLENAMSLKVETDKAKIDPSPVPGAQNFTYIILGLFSLLFIGILLGVLYSNGTGNGKKVRATSWFPEGFTTTLGSVRSRVENHRHASSVADAAGGNFRRNNRLNRLELGSGLKHSTSIRYQADGQEMRQFKSHENLFNDEKSHCVAAMREGIYEEPDLRLWTNEHYNAIQPNAMTPPLPTTASFVDVPGPHGQTPLMAAITTMPISNYDHPEISHDSKVIADLLNSGANPNLVCDKSHESSLHLAARYCRADAAKRLIDMGADVNAHDVDGRTPLHTAIAAGARGVFEIMLSNRKTDINAKTYDGLTPLMIAAKFDTDSNEMVEQLIKHNCDLNLADEKGQTALHWAVAVGNVRATEMLLASGADRDAKNNNEETPLFRAANEGSYACARLLLDYHANRDITDHMDRLPRDVAVERRHSDIQNLLDHHEPAAMPPHQQVISPGSCASSIMSPNSANNGAGGWANSGGGTLGRNTLSRRKAQHQHQTSTLSTATEMSTLMSTTASMCGTLKKNSPTSPPVLVTSPVGGNSGPPPPLPPPRNNTSSGNSSNNNASAVTPYSTACQPMQLQQLLSPNTPQPILLLGSGAPDGASMMQQAGSTQLMHSNYSNNTGNNSNSNNSYPPPLYGHTQLLQLQQQQPALHHQQQQQQHQIANGSLMALPQTPVQLTELHHLNGHSPYSFEFSPPNSMLTSSAMISPPSRPPPPYEDVCFKQQQQQQQQQLQQTQQHQHQHQQQQQMQTQQQVQPIAVAPRHMNLTGSGQPPTPTATTAPNLGGPNGNTGAMMRWQATGATGVACTQSMIGTAQQPSQQGQSQQMVLQPQRPPDSYPTPSPDSWGSLSTSSPLSAHDWSAGGAMGDSLGGSLGSTHCLPVVAGGQMGAQGMIMSPNSTLSAAQTNPRFQPTSTQQAVFI